MKKIQIIGSTTLIGKNFIDINSKYQLECFSRRKGKYNFLDIKDISSFSNYSFKNSFLVSFAPIWVSSQFLINLENFNKKELKSLHGIIFYSSTSVLTKRFSSNKFDKELYAQIALSEKNIVDLCKKYSLNLVIVRPTMIYGSYKGVSDKNLSLISNFLKKIPFCFFPNVSGLRQPIHFSQLSKLTFFLIDQLIRKNKNQNKEQILIDIGGDEELEYREILVRLSDILSIRFSHNCKIIPIPRFLYNLLIYPFILFNPKIFEALLRVGSNLSGFIKCSEYIGESLKKFPIDN